MKRYFDDGDRLCDGTDTVFGPDLFSDLDKAVWKALTAHTVLQVLFCTMIFPLKIEIMPSNLQESYVAIKIALCIYIIYEGLMYIR
jgi:hypothetical protein